MRSPVRAARALRSPIAAAGMFAAATAVAAGWVAAQGGDAYSIRNATREAFSQPIPRMAAQAKESFLRGRSLFRQNWVIAPSGDDAADGLGPFHNRISCIACHNANGKGHAPDSPGERAASLLVRLSVTGRDAHGGVKPHPVYGDQFREDSVPGVPAPGRVAVSWRTHGVRLAGGDRVELRAPVLRFDDLSYGPLDDVQTSARIGPAVFGLGLLEAVPEQVLEAMAREPKADGVKGKVNRVYDAATGTMVAGRFGLKSNRGTLRDQIAAAMSGDLGITSSLAPEEHCTATQAACRQAANGGAPELTDRQLDDLQVYLTFLAPPAPRAPQRQDIVRGTYLFRAAGCTACHRPQLPVGAHPLLGAARGTIAPYTDLLLHDMGKGLADHRPDYAANGREWRTAPLWGMGLLRRMNERAGYLHDGRARTVQEAILWHGGEAGPAQRRYANMPARDRDALLAFLDTL